MKHGNLKATFGCLMVLSAVAQAASPVVVSVPHPWREHVHLDQNHNVARKMRPGRDVDDYLPEDEKLVRPTYYVEIPKNEVSVTVDSDGITPDISAFMSPDPEKVRLYFVDVEGNNGRVVFKDDPKIYDAHSTKLMSHGTRFTFKEGVAQPIHIKMQHEQFGALHNPPSFGELAVQHSALIRKALKKNPPQTFVFLNEPFAASVKRNGAEYSFSLRQAGPVSKTTGMAYLPLHGVLSEEQMEQFGKVFGSSAQDWIDREYLPKVAQAMAELHHVCGIVPQAHTQNILVEIDPKTANIARFVLRDSSDVMFDVFNHFDELSLLPNEHGTFAKVNVTYTRLGKESMGNHFRAFTSQSFFAFTNHRIQRAKNGAVFFKSYLKATEKYLNHAIVLSSAGQAILNKFERGGDGITLAELKDLSGVLFQEISDIATQIKIAKKYPGLIQASPNPTLKAIVLSKQQMGDFAAAWADTVERLDSNPDEFVYREVGDKIFVHDLHGKLHGFAYHVTNEDRLACGHLLGVAGSQFLK